MITAVAQGMDITASADGADDLVPALAALSALGQAAGEATPSIETSTWLGRQPWPPCPLPLNKSDVLLRS